MRPPPDYSSVDQEDFDEQAMLHLGCRRVEYNQLSGEDRDLLLHYWGMMQHEIEMHRQAAMQSDRSVPPIYVDFVRSLSANAAVFPRRHGGYWLAVADGSHMVIATAFAQIFRHRRLLPDIGDASIETEDGPIVIDDSRILVDESAITTEKWQPISSPWASPAPPNRIVQTLRQPKHPDRLAAYALCVALYYHFLVFHEMGHVYMDHFGLLRSRGEPERTLRFFETSESLPPQTLRPSESHALEIEADQWSTLQLLGKLSSSGNLLRFHPLKATHAGLDRSSAFLQLRLFFVTHIVFCAMVTNRSDLAQQDERRHPHHDVRFHYLFAQFQRHLGMWVQTGLISGSIAAQIRDVIPQVVRDTHHLRGFLDATSTSTPGRSPYTDTKYLSAIQDRIAAINDAFIRLRGGPAS